MKLDKENLIDYLKNLEIKTIEERDHAIKFENYGKAAEKDGRRQMVVDIIRKIELGDFNID